MFSFVRKKIYFYKKFTIHKINRTIEYIYLTKQRLFLKNTDFTIISNNCWAGSIYQDLKLQYKTPTVGLFFFAPCYIKFLQSLVKNMNSTLYFSAISKYEKGNILKKKYSYPIGIINNEIEIHFLHYKDEKEALIKWNNRKNRINWNNLFIAFSDNEICSNEEIESFDSLPYPKVFFSSKKIEGVKSLIFLKSYKGQPGIGNIYDDRWKYRKYFNVVKWLNKYHTKI